VKLGRRCQDLANPSTDNLVVAARRRMLQLHRGAVTATQSVEYEDTPYDVDSFTTFVKYGTENMFENAHD
jgi:hypothetical protein